MKKSNGWVNALFALVFIATPAIMAFYFWLPGWSGVQKPLWFYWVVSIGYLLYSGLFSLILIKLEILSIDSLNFNIPITLVFIAIFVSFNWHIALRIVIVILCVLFAFPVNIYTNKYIEQKIIKNNSKILKKKHR